MFIVGSLDIIPIVTPIEVMMADNIVPIASAVILPTHPPELVTALSKRRQSPASEPDSKKLRLDQDDIPQSENSPEETSKNEANAPFINPEKKEERRRISVVEEKKRGQRLFGSMLSALSQSAPNGYHKRRLEVQKHQIEREKTQNTQTDTETQKGFQLTKLNSVRIKEQIKFDEETMRIRHTNMRAMANFLCTKTEPRLYYKPWEFLPKQKDCIDSQISSVAIDIERELSDFKQRCNGCPKPEEEKKFEETSLEILNQPCTEYPNKNSNTEALNTTDNVAHPPAKKDDKDVEREGEKEEHNGEVMVENEEDTVIY